MIAELLVYLGAALVLIAMLSNCFTEVLTYAKELHANQVRKGSGVPYIAHLLGVASLALGYGAIQRRQRRHALVLSLIGGSIS